MLASDLRDHQLGELVDECLLSGRAKLAEFDRIYDRIAGGRVSGSARLRAILEDHHIDSYGIESTYLERLLERILDDPRIPPSIREHPMTINGAPSRVDVFIPEWAVVVEADSRRWHGRLEDFERDRARDNALAAQGIQIARLSYNMLKEDPAGCLETLLAVGAIRRAPRTV
jgi:very-short-patch-repair endonuclease